MASEGETDAARIVAEMRRVLEAEPMARIDYVEAVDANSIEPVESLSRETLFAMAVYIGKTRLIDNFIVQATEA